MSEDGFALLEDIQLGTIRRFVRKWRFNKGAVLGNEDGLIYAGRGKAWVRFRAGTDGDGNVTFAPAVKANRGSAQFFEYPGAPVRIVYDYNDELAIQGVDNREADNAGLDTGLLNYASRSSRWLRLKNVTRLAARPVGTDASPSTLVTVRSLIYDTDYASLYRLEATGQQSDKVDLASYIPSAGNHAVVCIFMRTVDNTFQVVSSTAQGIGTELDLTDYQECFTQRDPETIPVQGFILGDAQTSITIADLGEDLRQFVNMPRSLGLPTPVDMNQIIRTGRTVTHAGSLTVTAELTTQGTLTQLPTAQHEAPRPCGPVHIPLMALYNSLEACTATVNASALYNGYITQNSPADNQTVYRSRAWLTPGQYLVRCVHLDANNGGIFQVNLVGPETVSTSTVDTYAAATSYNNIDDDTVQITKSGEFRIDVVTNGKNAASSNYYVHMQSIDVIKQ